MRKDNEVYKSYYELYSQFNFYLEDAKSLLQECKGNAKDNCMMECTMNLNVRYYKNRIKNEDHFYVTKQYLLLQVRRGGDLRIVWRKQIMSTTVKNEPTTPPPLL